MSFNSKISLIGMPWAGKSTIGKALADAIHYDFIDLDLMVEQAEGMSLIDVMNLKGADYFRNMQNDLLQKLPSQRNIVISPAGSIIYQQQAMKWLTDNSRIIFLNTPYEVIETRSKELPKAVAGLKEKGLRAIWDERIPIYESFAADTVNTTDKKLDEIISEIITKLKQPPYATQNNNS